MSFLSIQQNQVYSFKLNSGEELIAKVVMVNQDYIVLTHPVSVAPGPQGMGLVPSMFTADVENEVTLRTSGVSLFGLTEENVKNKYIEATTGIKLPEKKLIIG